jgi:hypothetical protein
VQCIDTLNYFRDEVIQLDHPNFRCNETQAEVLEKFTWQVLLCDFNCDILNNSFCGIQLMTKYIPQVNFEQCVWRNAESEIGCKLNWSRFPSVYGTCSNNTQLNMFRKVSTFHTTHIWVFKNRLNYYIKFNNIFCQ